MLFSIITPSFRDSDWLKLCVSSVADQGVDLEHIVQDGGSDDGTLAWLLKDKRVKPFVERDSGMYDAINRGLRRAAGQILAYLNCDEQYLPGTLKSVADYFRRNPAREVVFSDTIVANATGNYICHRRASLPRKYHTLVSGNLAALTCSIFFRRSVISQHGIFFDPHLEHVGDCRWVLKLIEKGIPRGVMPSFTSVFSDTGTNISLLPAAARERAELLASAPGWARVSKPLIILQYRLRRLLSGHYMQKPFSYSIYTLQSPDTRVSFNVSKPKFRWIR